MPSWLTPITSDMFSIARSVVRAKREPARRAARSGYGARRRGRTPRPTKNALPSSSRMPEQRPRSGCSCLPHPRLGRSSDGSSSRRSVSRSMRRPSMCSTREHGELLTAPRRRRRGSTTGQRRPRPRRRARGTRPSTLDQQAGDGVVVLVLGQLEPGRVLDLVGAEQAGDDPRAVGTLPQPGAERSCSSAMSPTISSITSSRVTMPAVSPYSSETTASWNPSPRSSDSSGSSRSESGTTVGVDHQVADPGRTRARSGAAPPRA